MAADIRRGDVFLRRARARLEEVKFKSLVLALSYRLMSSMLICKLSLSHLSRPADMCTHFVCHAASKAGQAMWFSTKFAQWTKDV